MKTIISLLLVIFAATLLSVSTSFAEFSLFSIGKAYFEDRRYDLAVEKLEAAVKTNTGNAEAYYLLGCSYEKLGNSYLSSQRFQSAIAISLNGRGNLHKTIAYMSADQIAKAKVVFDEAIEKNPASKQKIASQLFDYAESRLRKNDPNEAHPIFLLACAYDQALNDKACDLFYRLGKISESAALNYWPQASGYCAFNQKRKAEMGELILRVAAKSQGQQRKNLKEKAFWFLPQQRVDQIIPPPHWETVLSKTFEGRGLTDDDWVPIAAAPIEIKVGDQLIITGRNFEFFDQGRWQPFQNKMEMTNIIGTTGSFGAKAEKGELFKIEVRRLIE